MLSLITRKVRFTLRLNKTFHTRGSAESPTKLEIEAFSSSDRHYCLARGKRYVYGEIGYGVAKEKESSTIHEDLKVAP